MKNTQSHLKTSYLNCQGLETNSFCLPTVLNPSETKALRVVSGSNGLVALEFIKEHVEIDKTSNKSVTRIYEKEAFSRTIPQINHEIMLQTNGFVKHATESMLQVIALFVYFSASHKYITVGIKELAQRTGVCIRELKYILAHLEARGFFNSLYNGKKKWKTYRLNPYVLSRRFLKPLAKRIKWLWGVLSVNCTLLINNSVYTPFYKEWLSRKRSLFLLNQNTKNSYKQTKVTYVTDYQKREEFLDKENEYTNCAYQYYAQEEFDARIGAKELLKRNFSEIYGEEDGLVAFNKEVSRMGEGYFEPKDLTHPNSNEELVEAARILHDLDEVPIGGFNPIDPSEYEEVM